MADRLVAPPSVASDATRESNTASPSMAPLVQMQPMSLSELPRVTPQAFAPSSPVSQPHQLPSAGDHGDTKGVHDLPLNEISEWRSRFDGLYSRLEASLGQSAVVAQAQDEETAQYKVATQTRIDQLTLLRDSLQADVARLNESERALRQLLQKRDERIRDLEQENYALRAKATQSVADAKQATARATAAELARRVGEVRQKELEVSSGYAISEVSKLRARLLQADEATRDSLLAQLGTFETLRQQVIDRFTEREATLVGQMNATVASVHDGLRQELRRYCDTLQTEQTRSLSMLDERFQAFCAQRDRQYGDQLAQYQRRCGELEIERQHIKDRCDADVRNHTEQCKRREDQLLRVIADREQALLQREARVRADQDSQQRELEGRWAAKEADLVAKHDATLQAVRDESRRDVLQMQTSFLDQIQKLSDAHLSAEQELQERHRERERTLAQGARRAAAQPVATSPDDSSETFRRSTDTSFLSKFDAIEARQRERAEQVRSTLLLRRNDEDAK